MPKRIAGVSWHWWAFTDICKLCELEFNFIGKIETFQQDVSCLVNNFPEYAILQSMEHKTKEKLNANADHDKGLSMKYFSELTKSQVLDLSFRKIDKDFFFKSQCELNKEPIWQYCGFKNFVRLQLNKYETTSNCILLSQNLTSDCLLI